ncbi:hypothetical protein [Breznakia pachnodae]|uniref:CarD-like/TRCF RNAP-interacting domain-containing protein n=1 Tax=Breznakia pachnodae TaxID=265178 RepID=A0ABU0E6M7_9FIRM|nr:hypothetical protein [Breznakia pachnodae]MDQ0362530.1 hypothetical protein [Breznakia pachnodae]
MKKYYFLAIAVNEEYGSEPRIYSSTKKIKKNDYVVIPNYDEEPITAQVTSLISEIDAITKYRYITDVIDVVDMKAYTDKRTAQYKKQVLNDKMQELITQQKNLDTLEKYAGKNPEMARLLEELKALDEPTAEPQDEDPDTE